jgi:hypothetical protein
VRTHAVAFARIVFFAAVTAMTIVSAESKTCPRPKDQLGRPLYETLTGTLESSGLSRNGTHFAAVKFEHAAASVSFGVTDKMYAVIQSLAPGTRITLVAYYRSAMSGARPAYTCVEVAPEQQNKKGG